MNIVVYDICSQKRLTKISSICERYGVRIQKSVFECDINESDIIRLKSEINKIIDHEKDSFIIYSIPVNIKKFKYYIGKKTNDQFVLL